MIDGLPQFMTNVLDREAFVTKHYDLLCRPNNGWRERVRQAQNLVLVAQNIAEDCFLQFLPFYMSLCIDEVAEVRSQACAVCFSLISRFPSLMIP